MCRFVVFATALGSLAVIAAFPLFAGGATTGALPDLRPSYRCICSSSTPSSARAALLERHR